MRTRLIRRGLTLSAALLASLLAQHAVVAGLPATLMVQIVKAAALVASAGTVRIATSPSSMGLRLAMSRTATTTLRCSTAIVSVRFANRSATNTTPPTRTPPLRP